MMAWICGHPGCYVTVHTPRSYCDKHKAYHEAQKAKRAATSGRWGGANRPNMELYNSPQWHKLRDEIRAENPQCARCGATEGLSCHHVNLPKGDTELFFDKDNIVILCAVCHAKVTSAENRRFA